MLKKALLIGLGVGVGLAALHAITAEAGTWSYLRPPGMWWYYGSVDGCATIGRVPNPEKKPALMNCTIEIAPGDSFCVNPDGHNVLPGEAGRKISVSEPIEPEDLSEKYKGVANVCVSIAPECELRNWNLVVTEFEATCSTYPCLDAECTSFEEEDAADTQVCHCRLPLGADFDNLEACKDPFDLSEDCTRYECWQVNEFGEETDIPCQLSE
jgi:hypothetical protein